ncbi:cellulose synthase subunit BcsC-related outer membrane protein [Robbsia sp. KACC 23696]|uniref:cellulose biosynthesis protein BcsC n=1 Tax=Robbsia sp. KACC 23696 TaxID=3149231 RepID=UPI00325B402F
MQVSRRQAWIMGLLVGSVSHPVWAQEATSAILLEQGRYWQAHDKPDLAAQSWSKLLVAEPNQPEGLYGLGVIAVGKKQFPVAQGYLSKLRAVAPNSRFVPLLEQDLRLAVDPGKSLLAKARQQAQDAVNQNDLKALAAAIGVYDQALGGKTPQGVIAREYYTYLGYTNGGTDKAIQGLERLNGEMPNDPYVLLPMAQHMVRDEKDRAAGVALLEKLSSRQDIGGAATEAWRSVLTWVPPTPQNRAWFEDYLKLHPDDEEIRHQMLSPRASTGNGPPVPVMDPRLTRGFAAFKAGDITVAEQSFSDVLRDKPNNADALGGLGLVRMQQGDLAQAQDLLSRAAARPGAGANWAKPLNSARYWLLVNQAEGAQNLGDYATARRELDEALKLDPNEPGGRNASGRLYAAQGNLKQAETVFRGVLATDPNNREAVSGLIDILAQTGRADEAQKWVDSMTPAQQAGIGGLDRLRAAVATARADAAQQRGDMAGAQKILEDAQRADPNNPWLRLGLARFKLQQGHSDEARQLVDGLLASNPDNPDALYASALLAMQMGDWSRAQDTMGRIPAGSRTPNMVATAQLIDFQAVVARADQTARDGNQEDARNMLARLEPAAGKDPARVSALAEAYVDAGDLPRAMRLMRGLMPSGLKDSGPDVQLAYASLMLKAGQNVQAADAIRILRSETLTADQRQRLDDINYLYSVRLADQQRQQGDLADAYDTLAPILAARPNDSLANAALARMYAADGQYDKALSLYQKALASDPDNPGLQLGVAMAAVQAGKNGVADDAVKAAIAKAPNDPDVLAGAARVYVMQGKFKEGQTLLESAIAIKEKRLGVPPAGSPEALADNHVAGNPFTHSRRAYRRVAPAGGAPDTAFAGQTTTDDGFAIADRGDAPTPASAAASSSGRSWSTTRPIALPSVAGTPIGAPIATDADAANATPDDGTSLASMRRDLNDLQSDRSPEIRAGVFVESNNGSPGTSKLTNVQEPLEGLVPLGNGKLSVRVTPVELSGSTLGTDIYSASQFGGGPAATQAQQAGTVRAPSAQTAYGVGIGFGYEARNWVADLGTTPIGFRYNNVIGGATYRAAIDPAAGTWYNVGLSRRAVTESITSFAGSHDTRTGETWGGVTSSALHGAIGLDVQDYGVYGYGSVKYLDGHNVRSNTGAEAGAGAYWYFHRTADSMLTAGMNVSGMFYDHNENNFTFGNGGYFSPQSYYAFSIPVTWAQRSDRWTYKLQGSAGIQSFRQDSAPYFPTNAALQASAVAAAAAIGLTDGAVHAGQSSSGFNYNLLASAEYRFTHRLTGGASVGANNSSSYKQWVAGIYVRYNFTPQTKAMALPLIPYQSHYNDQ